MKQPPIRQIYKPGRRRFLQLAGIGLSACTRPASALFNLTNPCLNPKETPATSLESIAWQGINPEDWWDCHTHIIGSGDTNSGITVSPDMDAPFTHPIQTLQHWFYANAACIDNDSGQDAAFVNRLLGLMNTMPKGAKAMLFAFDKAHLVNGGADDAHTAFHVPNEYAKNLAQRYPDRFEWVASIHPYRRDCVRILEESAASGARAVKWLPPTMGIDPASAECDRFYQAAAGLNIPIITHGGEENAVHGANQALFGNPMRLQRAMDAGVRIVIAHCASLGKDYNAERREVRSFDIFSKLMSEKQWEGLLFGDISAIVLRNRDPEIIKTLLTEESWHSRLLNGSDYPLTGVLPLISPGSLAAAGLLAEDGIQTLSALQNYHPFRFDFVLKRSLSWHGKRFANSVFATRPFFVNE